MIYGSDKVKIVFNPFGGYYRLQSDSYKKYGDSFMKFKNMVNDYPEMKVLVTNNGLHPCLFFFDKESIKDITHNIDRYEKMKGLIQ
jgi:hypothetical protein